VTAEKWVYGGDALSRSEGRVVLAPFLLPGETARVEIQQERPDLFRAKPVEIVSPSAERAQPACPYFSRCGGCHYQHAAYPFQVSAKADVLREQFRRVGKVDYPGEIETITAGPLGYRNRTQFHVRGNRVGFFAAGTRDLLAVEQCPISSPRINQALAALGEMSRDRQWPQFLRSVEVFTNESGVLLNVEAGRPLARRFFDWCAERIPGAARGFLDYPAGSDTFRVSHNSFFQTNRFLVGPLVEAALDGAAGDSALDLYAGAGLFSVALARKFARTTAVESGRSAVRDLEHNARQANVALEGVGQSVEEFLPSLDTAPDFVLADPPRAGLGKAVSRELLRLKPPAITIVSCDPSTLARDVGALSSGGYRMERLRMVDLFPQTYHLESVAYLRLAQ
jgi:23S rRNA (uracil1939-C5)-methyltransferase